MRAALLALTALTLFAQSAAVQRTVVLRQDVSTLNKEAVVARVEVIPGGYAGRHTHPGEEISYVIEGELELIIDGQQPRTYKAGESFLVPAGAKHNGHNPGTVPVKFSSVYLIERGAVLTTPAP